MSAPALFHAINLGLELAPALLSSAKLGREGNDFIVQAKGFRDYIRTAEANQLRFEEGADIFSRYLPYAIVFHATEKWARAFAGRA